MSLSKLLTFFGIICFISAAFLFWQRYNPQRLAFALGNYSSQTNTSNSTAAPTKIIIPAINLDLPILPANLNKRQWEATTKGISWLSSSPLPGSAGNSILYGHNWPNLLGNITKLKPGQVIKIKFMDGSTKDFVIDSTVTVSPNEISILAPSKAPQITLYTCTGFLDNKRFVIVAKPKLLSYSFENINTSFA